MLAQSCYAYSLLARQPHGPLLPKTLNRPAFGWFLDTIPWSQPLVPPPHPYRVNDGAQSTEICRHFSEERCCQLTYKYRHTCGSCQEPHAWVNCPCHFTSRRHSPLNLPPCLNLGMPSGSRLLTYHKDVEIPCCCCCCEFPDIPHSYA